MDVTKKTEGKYSVIALSGEIDLHCSPQARDEILGEINQDKPVLIDLFAVSYIDSSGIASLVEGFQLAKTKNLDFALVAVSEPVMQVLQLARLDKVFPIHPTAQDAASA